MDEISFGEWLRRQRKVFGFTQKQLAERLNCAAITLRKIEAEQRRPSIQIAVQLAQVLGIPAGEYGSFIQFARGYRQFAPAAASGITPWHSAIGSLIVELPTKLASLLGSGQNLAIRNGYLLDANSFIHMQDEPTRRYSTEWMEEITPAGSASDQGSIPMIMLIPVEVPAQLANTLIQTQAVDESVGIISKIMTGI